MNWTGYIRIFSFRLLLDFNVIVKKLSETLRKPLIINNNSMSNDVIGPLTIMVG